MRYLIFVVLLCSCAHQAEFMKYNQKQVYWNKVNLPIPLEYGPLGEKSIAAYTFAATWINQQLGCQVFDMPKWAADVRQGAVDLTCYNEMEEPEGLTSLDLNDNGMINKAKIIIPCMTPFDETQQLIATHELFHIIGLEHDSDLGTIMYRSVVGAALKLQEEDKVALQVKYCEN
jgi:hypothetical protein